MSIYSVNLLYFAIKTSKVCI